MKVFKVAALAMLLVLVGCKEERKEKSYVRESPATTPFIASPMVALHTPVPKVSATVVAGSPEGYTVGSGFTRTFKMGTVFRRVPPAPVSVEPEPEPELPKTLKLSWTVPVTRKNGDPLQPNDIAGYELYYLNEDETVEETVLIDGEMSTTYEIEMPEGIWYFSVAAIDQEGLYSDFSNIITHEVPGAVVEESELSSQL